MKKDRVLNWKIKMDHSLEMIKESSPYSKIRSISPILSELGFYQHIQEPSKDNYLLYASILRYLGSHQDPSGFGIGLGCMAMANLCGQILRTSNRMENLNQLTKGNAIYSLAVSEKGWRGRLHNLSTSILPESSNISSTYLLNGSKDFATNGRQADVYIVIAKNFEGGYSPVILPANTDGLLIQAFDLLVCKEATHAKIIFQNISLSSDNLLMLDYRELGRFLPSWERFAFHFLILGLLDSISESILYSKGIELGRFQLDLKYLEDKIYSRLERIPETGIQSMKPRDGLILSRFISEYFYKSEWEKLYPGFVLIRQLFT